MNEMEHKQLQEASVKETLLHVEDCHEGTLLYGYDHDRTTVHVYRKDNLIHLFKYSLKQFISHETFTTVEARKLIPSKRSYTDRSSFTFALLLKQKFDIDVSLTGKASDEFKEGGFHEPTHEQDGFIIIDEEKAYALYNKAAKIWSLNLLDIKAVATVTMKTLEDVGRYDLLSQYYPLSLISEFDKIDLVEKVRSEVIARSFIGDFHNAIYPAQLIAGEMAKKDAKTGELIFNKDRITELEGMISDRFTELQEHEVAKNDSDVSRALDFAYNMFSTLSKKGEFYGVMAYANERDFEIGTISYVVEAVTEDDALTAFEATKEGKQIWVEDSQGKTIKFREQ